MNVGDVVPAVVTDVDSEAMQVRFRALRCAGGAEGLEDASIGRHGRDPGDRAHTG